MCGIVGAVAQRFVAPILLEGLKRLEYRGYDSAGMAVLGQGNAIERQRVLGKVAGLEAVLNTNPLDGTLGIAHTRWATHGAPSTHNAHPHMARETVALVHNGIIENHGELREKLRAAGYEFSSETDTEVAVNQVHQFLAQGKDLLGAVQATAAMLEGAFALGVMCSNEPGRLIAARRGSPLVIGLGIGENFIASDVFALLPVTQRFIFLEDGDTADIRRQQVTIYDANLQVVQRPESVSQLSPDAVEKSGYRHFMLKEIFTQALAVAETLEGRVQHGLLAPDLLGPQAESIPSDP